MTRTRVAEVKRERRKALFLREMSTLIQSIASDEPAVAGVYVTHVDISPNSGILYVYFAAFKEPGEEAFKTALSVLKLYKPSIRKAFAQRIQTRYAPDIVFVFNKVKERERRVNDLLDKVIQDLNPTKPATQEEDSEADKASDKD